MPTAGAPRLSNCRPLAGRIDPQGRQIWLRAGLRPQPGSSMLFIAGIASSEAWLNGAPLGANGRPAALAGEEVPGRYEFAAPLPREAWRPGDNTLVLRLSSFHGGIRLGAPVGVWVGEFGFGQRLPLLAATFVAAGCLFAALFGFAAIWAVRRTGSSLSLAALSGVAALQAVVESLRTVFNYAYPLHAWRLSAILALSAVFALLLVHHAAMRFMPRRRGVLLAATGAAVVGCAFLPGFDTKSSVALLTAAVLAGVAAAAGVHEQRPGSRATLAILAVFVIVALAAPVSVLDLPIFLLATALTLPLLVSEVLRLGRDDAAREAALTRAASRPDRLTVSSARGVELVPIREIVAILGADDYAELLLHGGRRLLHAARLERLEDELPPGFFRCHRSAIANLAFAERLEREGQRWRLHMADGPPLPVSRARLAALRDVIEAPRPTLRAIA